MRSWTRKIAVGYEGGAAGYDALVLGELLTRTAGGELLAVGSRGRGPVGSVLLGSTAAAVIAASPCPVVVVPRPALAIDS